MKKSFTYSLALAAAAVLTAAPDIQAQNELPETFDGYYRLTNASSGLDLAPKGAYTLGAETPAPANAATVVSIATDEVYSFAKEMDKLQELLDSGVITDQEYTQLFITLMGTTAWKGGYYPVTRFEMQGQDYMKLMERFPEYAETAMQTFLDENTHYLYDEYYTVLLFMCAVAPDVIAPANLNSEEAFGTWLENYLNKWRKAADFGLYMTPVYVVPEDDPEGTQPAVHNGCFYFQYHTPPYVGSMEKCQQYINNMLSDNGNDPHAPQLDIWETAKDYLFRAMEEDYAAGSPEMKFVKKLLDPTFMNSQYVIGLDKKGNMWSLQMPDAFNTQGLVITLEEVAQCTWAMTPVDSEHPLCAAPSASVRDDRGNYYGGLFVPFDVRLESACAEAYTIASVDAETGIASLERIAGGVIPALTPAVVRSESTDWDENILAITEPGAGAPAALKDLGGNLLPEANPGHCVSLGESNDGPAFNAYLKELPANNIWYSGTLNGISVTEADGTVTTVYDLQGRKAPEGAGRTKGICITNGTKTVR